VGDTDDIDRDAFGQPLAKSGATSTVPRATPPVAPAPPKVRVPREPRRSPLPFVFTIVAIALTALVLYDADRRSVNSPAVVFREMDGHALNERSLVRAANFRRALAAIQNEMEPGEDLLSLRLTPQELGSTVRDPNGNTRLVDVGLDFKVEARDWSTDTSSTPLDIAAINPAAPQKVVRGALREAGVDDTHLNYLSLSGGEQPSWYVQLKDVRIGDQTWSADLAGIAVTRPGELPFAEGLTGRSLLAEENLAAALEKVGTYGRQVTSLHLSPQQLRVSLRGDGGSRDVQVDAAGRVTTRTSPGGGNQDTVRIDQIDPGAPARGFTRAMRKGGLSPSKIDYTVLFSGREWGLYFKGVPQRRSYWRASADGRQVERLG